MNVNILLHSFNVLDTRVSSAKYAFRSLLCRSTLATEFDHKENSMQSSQQLQLQSPSQKIRSLVADDEGRGKYVLVVEHDLAILDYLSDYICCLYGTPSAYGVVTMPFSVREGINIFLAGFVPTENLRFRDEELNFKMSNNKMIKL
jgi:ATP-binding cassette subfamily E protein 1